MRIQTLTLRRRTTGVMVGLLLTLLFFGDLLHRCGDVEKNPGPDTRSSSRTSSTDRGSDGTVGQQQADDEPTLKDVMCMLHVMNSKFDEMKGDMQDLSRAYTALKEEVRDLRDEVTGLKRVNDDMLNENDELKAKLENLERVTDDLEGRSRRSNLLFHGLPRLDNESNEECEARIKELLTDALEMADDVQFDRVHRLNSSKKSPIIVRCTFYRQKVAILKAKQKLKDGYSGIFIGEDFTQRVREVRRNLVPHLKKAKDAGKRATMVFDYLVVEGKRFMLDRVGDLVEKQ